MQIIVSQIFSYIAYAYLPGFITSTLQSLYYRITIRAGSPHPNPASARYARHKRRIYIFVITTYLFYTLYESYDRICQDGDFYETLGVLPTADDRTIKSRFRRLAAVHHPDKVQQGVGEDSEDTGSAEEYFVLLKFAQDTLIDPTKRFVYDRFGADVFQDGQNAKTLSQYLYTGMYTMIPQYAVGLMTMIVLNLFWFPAWGRYWRFYTFFALFTLEVSLLTRPNAVFMPGSYLPDWLSTLLGLNSFYLLPFQILTLARTLSVTLNIFISQLASQAQQPKPAKEGGIGPQVQRLALQLTHISRAQDVTMTRQLRYGFMPFSGDKKNVTRLRKEMKGGLISNTVGDDAEVKEAVANARKRRVA